MTDSTISMLLQASASIQAVPPQVAEGSALSSEALIQHLSALQSQADTSNLHTTLLSLLAAHQGNELPIEEEAYLTLYFIDNSFQLLARSTSLSPLIMEQVFRLRPMIAKLALMNNSWLDKPEHIIHSMLNEICLYYLSWDDSLGLAGDKSLAILADGITELAANTDIDETRLKIFWRDLKTLMKKEQEKFLKVVNRVCASEETSIKVRKSQLIAADYLNKLTTKKQLPLSMSEFLQGPWLQVIQQSIRNNGINSKEWEGIRKITTNLIWASIPSDDAGDLQKKFDIVPKLLELIRQQTSHLDEEEQNQLISPLDQLFYLILQKKPVDIEAVPPLPSHALSDDADIKISENLIQKASQIKRGTWFSWSDADGNEQRCMLALTLPEVNEVVFVNKAGVKTIQTSLDKFAYKISLKQARPLPTERPFSLVYLELTKELLKNYDKKQAADKIAEEEESLRIHAEKKARAEAAARAKVEAEQLAEAREQARKKAEAEAKLAEERRKIAELEASEREAAEKEAFAITLLENLNLGDWVEMEKNNSLVVCKLSLKIKSSDKYIFTDKNGIKIGEYKGNDLKTLITNEKFRGLDAGENPEGSLAKIIGTIRGDG